MRDHEASLTSRDLSMGSTRNLLNEDATYIIILNLLPSLPIVDKLLRSIYHHSTLSTLLTKSTLLAFYHFPESLVIPACKNSNNRIMCHVIPREVGFPAPGRREKTKRHQTLPEEAPTAYHMVRPFELLLYVNSYVTTYSRRLATG